MFHSAERNTDMLLVEAHGFLLDIIDASDPTGKRVSHIPTTQASGQWLLSLEKIEGEYADGEQPIKMGFVRAGSDVDTETYTVFTDCILDAYDEELDEIGVTNLLGDLQQVLENPKLRGITSLEGITDRRQAMRRYIGPTVTALTYEQAAIDEREPTERLYENIKADPLAGPWLSAPRNYQTITNAVLGFDTLLRGGESRNLAQDIGRTSTFVGVTDVRESLFRRFTAGGDSAASTFGVTYEAQARILSGIFLPAYIAAHRNCQTPAELLAAMNAIPLEEVKAIMETEQFVDGMREAASAINSAFSETNDLELFTGQLSGGDEVIYGVDSSLVTPIGSDFVEAPPHSELPHSFTTYNFYVRNDRGEIVINPAYFKSAQIGMRLDNEYRYNYEGLTPTAGCPGARRNFKVRQGDLLPEQLAAMKNELGFEVVETEKGTIIRSPRSAIERLHALHVQHLGNMLRHKASERTKE